MATSQSNHFPSFVFNFRLFVLLSIIYEGTDIEGTKAQELNIVNNNNKLINLFIFIKNKFITIPFIRLFNHSISINS